MFILCLIEDEPRHGYELIKLIEERTEGRYVPSPGVIYPTLAWLEDMGFVTTNSDGGRKSHCITPEGSAFLMANRQHADALKSRDWTRDDTGTDPIRAAMHAVKSALISMLRHAEPDAAKRTAVAEILNKAARDILDVGRHG